MDYKGSKCSRCACVLCYAVNDKRKGEQEIKTASFTTRIVSPPYRTIVLCVLCCYVLQERLSFQFSSIFSLKPKFVRKNGFELKAT